MENALELIRALVDARGWIDDPEAMAPYVSESRGLFQGNARAVIRPNSTTQVAEIVRLCHANRIGIVPQGGNTGRCGGATPDASGREIIIAMDRLNRIRHLDALDYTLTAEAGCILADIRAAAEHTQRLFPLRLGAEGSCQIGGNLATNAGGTNVLHYGNARDLTLGLEVVLPSGEIWDGLNTLRKNNSGYDLKDLFIGAEGTLGIITAAVLKLFPLPEEMRTAFVALRSLKDCVHLLARARTASSDMVSTFELIGRTILEFALNHVEGCRDPFDTRYDWYVLMVFSSPHPGTHLRLALEDTLTSAHEDGLVQDAVIAHSNAQATALWRLREAIVEAQRFEGSSIKHDVAVPIHRVPEFIQRASASVERELAGIRVCAFGHVGDGNIHYNLSQPVAMAESAYLAQRQRLNRIVHDIVMDMNGSFSAEHGIGRLKLEEMGRYKSATELNLMRQIKTTLDPRGIMNPGKVVPDIAPDSH